MTHQVSHPVSPRHAHIPHQQEPQRSGNHIKHPRDRLHGRVRPERGPPAQRRHGDRARRHQDHERKARQDPVHGALLERVLEPPAVVEAREGRGRGRGVVGVVVGPEAAAELCEGCGGERGCKVSGSSE